jgi:hypothetical protein
VLNVGRDVDAVDEPGTAQQERHEGQAAVERAPAELEALGDLEDPVEGRVAPAHPLADVRPVPHVRFAARSTRGADLASASPESCGNGQVTAYSDRTTRLATRVQIRVPLASVRYKRLEEPTTCRISPWGPKMLWCVSWYRIPDAGPIVSCCPLRSATTPQRHIRGMGHSYKGSDRVQSATPWTASPVTPGPVGG